MKIINSFNRNATELYGIVCFFCGLSCLCGPILAHFVIRETFIEDYLVVFWCGTALQVLSLILCLVLNTDKFNYDTKSKKFNSLNGLVDDVKKPINPSYSF
jgi:hypothetical protein